MGTHWIPNLHGMRWESTKQQGKPYLFIVPVNCEVISELCCQPKLIANHWQEHPCESESYHLHQPHSCHSLRNSHFPQWNLSHRSIVRWSLSASVQFSTVVFLLRHTLPGTNQLSEFRNPVHHSVNHQEKQTSTRFCISLLLYLVENLHVILDEISVNSSIKFWEKIILTLSKKLLPKLLLT